MEVKLIVFIEGNCRNERDMAFWVVWTPLVLTTKKMIDSLLHWWEVQKNKIFSAM